MTELGIATLLIAIIGAVCGVCGAVLGIINTCSQLSRNRVRLKVIPKLAYMVREDTVVSCATPTSLQARISESGAPSRLCVEVINMSAFAVSISDAGFGRANRTRHVIHNPEVSRGKTWPTRLESREAVTFFLDIGGNLDPEFMQHPFAYAKTDCGKVCYGTSPIFKEYLDRLMRDGGQPL